MAVKQTFNKVVMVGRLTMEPNLKKTKAGPVCEMQIMTTRKYGNGVDYHPIATFGKHARACAKHLRKNSWVLVEGEIINSFREIHGVKTKEYTVTAFVTFLESPRSANEKLSEPYDLRNRVSEKAKDVPVEETEE